MRMICPNTEAEFRYNSMPDYKYSYEYEVETCLIPIKSHDTLAEAKRQASAIAKVNGYATVNVWQSSPITDSECVKVYEFDEDGSEIL